MTTKPPVRVAVTGAAGNIGYALLFRIASGEMLGKDQPVILQLLEIPTEGAQKALKGVAMELDDCAFPLLQDMVLTDDPKVAFNRASMKCASKPSPRGSEAPLCARTLPPSRGGEGGVAGRTQKVPCTKYHTNYE